MVSGAAIWAIDVGAAKCAAAENVIAVRMRQRQAIGVRNPQARMNAAMASPSSA